MMLSHRLAKYLLFLSLFISFFNLPIAFSKDSTGSIVLAGGCFWCIEKDFEDLYGVISVESGYASAAKYKKPSYKQVASGKTKFREVVKVIFDYKKVTLENILFHYWQHVDPTNTKGMFVDNGFQYTSAIYFRDSFQETVAKKSKKRLESSKVFSSKIYTPIVKLVSYYPAQDYHQDFYKKEPNRYTSYRRGSGRDEFLNKSWGEKSIKQWLKVNLSELQYKVTKEEFTEPPFKNKYWNNKKEGVYIDIISGLPLFISKHKYKSGTGWPSFYETINKDELIYKADTKLGVERVELRSKTGNSHLGHLFKDGPKPTGLRYCINSASLKFIPKNQLKQNRLSYLRHHFK